MQSNATNAFSYVLDRAEQTTDVESLILSHAKLCAHIVNLICPDPGMRDELFSSALLGLSEAAKSFCPKRGVSFVTYAGKHVRGKIYETLNCLTHPVTPPARVSKTKKSIKDAVARLKGRGIDNPSASLIGKEAHCKAITVVAVGFLSAESESFDTDQSPLLVGLADGGNQDVVSPAENALTQDDVVHLRGAITSELSEIEKEVVSRYYGLDGYEPETLLEISRRFNKSRQRVSQLLSSAKESLKSAFPKKERSRECA